MKKYFSILIVACICAVTTSCKKDHYPEVENAANAQFTRDLGTTTATYNATTLSKASPATADKFTMKVIEGGTVASVKVVVDYKKGTTTTTQQYKEITSWPVSYTVSLNDLVALFASNGVTLANLTAGDKFVFRTIVTLKSGTVIAEQAAVLLAAPYATTLTYTVAN